MIMNKLFISFLSFVPMVASADYLNDKWTDLVKEKQELISELEKCQKNTKGFKIAGLATLGVSAIGVGVNIGEAVKINSLEDDVDAAKKRVADLDTKINEANNTCGTKNCPGASNIANAAEPVCIKDEWKVLKCANGYKEDGEHTCKRDGKDITYYDKCINVGTSSAQDMQALLAEVQARRQRCTVTEGACPEDTPNPEIFDTEGEFVCLNNEWWFQGDCAYGYAAQETMECDGGIKYVQICNKNSLERFASSSAHSAEVYIIIDAPNGTKVVDVLGGSKLPDATIGPCASAEYSFNDIVATKHNSWPWGTMSNKLKYKYRIDDTLKPLVEPFVKLFKQRGIMNGDDTEEVAISYLAVDATTIDKPVVKLIGCGVDNFFTVETPENLFAGKGIGETGDQCFKGCTGVQFDYDITTNFAHSGEDSALTMSHKACFTAKDAMLGLCEKYCKDNPEPVVKEEYDQSICAMQHAAVSDDGKTCYCNARKTEQKKFLWEKGGVVTENAN